MYENKIKSLLFYIIDGKIRGINDFFRKFDRASLTAGPPLDWQLRQKING